MALPCEMIGEILCRLPVKPLLRFRCVSKEWCSLIDSNAFAKKQLKNALDCNAGVGVMISKLDFGGEKSFYLAGFDSLDDESVSVVEIDDPLRAFLSDAHIVGASNGLMCVCKYVTKDVFLLNPTTRKTRKIACAPPEFPRSFRMGNSHLYGFGYDEVNDDFKVVLIATCYRQFHGLIAVVYSCKTNAWTRVQDVPSNIQVLGIMGLFASGSLHWRATTTGKIRKQIIVAFDLQRQLFKEVPFPPTETCADFNYLVNAGEYLCILEPFNSRWDVWLMNYPGAERTWCKAFSMEQQEIIDIYSPTKLVAFFRSGEDLLLELHSHHNTKLVWYNLHQKTIKDVRIQGNPVHFNSFLYTESLLQLTEDEPLPQKPSKDKPKKNKQHKRRIGEGNLGYQLNSIGTRAPDTEVARICSYRCTATTTPNICGTKLTGRRSRKLGFVGFLSKFVCSYIPKVSYSSLRMTCCSRSHQRQVKEEYKKKG